MSLSLLGGLSRVAETITGSITATLNQSPPCLHSLVQQEAVKTQVNTNKVPQNICGNQVQGGVAAGFLSNNSTLKILVLIRIYWLKKIER